MTIALRKLGYNPYHGSECFKNPPRDFNLWIEAMQCNFFNDDPVKKPPYGAEEFDRLIGSYDAVLDIPACFFWKDFLTAYPDAKVILTTRDIDAWYKSANATVFNFPQNKFFRFWHHFDPNVLGPLFRQFEMGWKIFSGNNYEEAVAKKAYQAHYDEIRAAVPSEKLLEFELGRSGWKEVCDFLGEEVLEEPWPQAYSTAEFQDHMDVAKSRAIRTIMQWTSWGLILGVGAYHVSKNWRLLAR